MDTSVFLRQLLSNKKNARNVKSFQDGSVLPSRLSQKFKVNNPFGTFDTSKFKYDPVAILRSAVLNRGESNTGGDDLSSNTSSFNKPLSSYKHNISDVLKKFPNAVPPMPVPDRVSETEGNTTSSDDDFFSKLGITDERVKAIFRYDKERFKRANRDNTLMSLLALGNKTINDLTAARAIGSMKPMVPMPPPATAHLRAEQIDPNAVSRDAATVLASLYSSGVSPASLKEVLNNAIESKRKVEEQNAKMRQEVSRQNIAASTDMANKYNLFYTETLNKNIAERNQLAKQTYLDASRMSYANAENIGRLLAGFSENEINSILSRIEALRYSLLASGWGYYNKYKANSLLANWLGYSNKSKDNNSDSKNKISYGPNTITS